ncbi:MAG: C-GCAxxG-C-C family (seleno)protein [Candidatus Thorarchaeota archaeon]|jgi:hypothetical protein
MSDLNFDEILTQAYKRMHRYTCAEASLQALLKLWDMTEPQLSWATAGYMGGILSGQGKDSVPEDHPEDRGTAIQAVTELYEDFKKEFGSTTCKTLSKVDFSDGDQLGQYIVEKKWKSTCDVFLGYTIRKLNSMVEDGKL